MKLRFCFVMFWGVIILLGMLPLPSRIIAQSLPLDQELWLFPPIDCQDATISCEVRLSLEEELYILENNTADERLMFYVSRHGEPTYNEYDLSPYHLWVGVGRIEFVPYSEQNSVIFYANAGSATLSLLNLQTGEMTLMPQTSEFSRLVECNGYIGRVGSFNHISRLGTGNQLLFCSLGHDHEFLVNIMDVVTRVTVQSYDFSLPWAGIGQPSHWDMLMGGHDGNIYLQVRYPHSMWEELTGSLPELPDWGLRLFKYNVTSESWSIRNILPEQMASSNYPPATRSYHNRIVAVMNDGSIIYLYNWHDLQSKMYAVEISNYSQDFQLLDRISSQSVGRPFGYIGISSKGLMLLRSGTGIAGLFTEQFELPVLPAKQPTVPSQMPSIPLPSTNDDIPQTIVFADHNVLVLQPDLTVELWDLNTLDRQVIAQAGRTNLIPPDVLLGYTMQPGSEFLYLVQGPSVDLVREQIVDTQVVQVNLLTGVITVIFEQDNINELRISPDGAHIIVSWTDENEFYGQGVRKGCLLDISTSQCVSLQLGDLSPGGFWLDETSYITGNIEREFFRVFIDTFTIEPLHFPEGMWINSWTRIPDTDLLLFDAVDRSAPTSVLFLPVDFFTYNLLNHNVELFHYNSGDARIRFAGPWKFSPDRQYLIYGSNPLAIVDFQTGELIALIEGTAKSAWLPDSRTLIIEIDENRLVYRTLVFNIETGSQVILRESSMMSGPIVVHGLNTE